MTPSDAITLPSGEREPPQQRWAFQQILTATFGPILWSTLLYSMIIALAGTFVARHASYIIEQLLAADLPIEIAMRLPPLHEIRENKQIPEVLQELKLANQEVDPYILDEYGNIVFAFDTPQRSSVSLTPLPIATADNLPDTPPLGDNPRERVGLAPFVAAPLIRGEPGYVYLILRSRIIAGTAHWAGFIRFAALLFVRFLPWMATSLLMSLLFALYITQSFRKIVNLVHAYASGNFSAEWKTKVHDDVDELARHVQSLARRIIERQQMASRQEARRRELLIDIVHDVRGPLTGIRATVDTMAHETIDEPTKISPDLIGALQAGGSTIEQLAAALRNSSSLDLSSESLDLEDMDPLHIAQGVVSQLRLKAKAAGVEISVKVEGKIRTIRADPFALERVLLNLAYNAIRHTLPGGEVSIRIRTAADSAIAFDVADTGVGIGPGDLPHIFDPFYRGSGQQLSEGAGMGLAIVKRLVELHGSEIHVESLLEKGTTFRFSLDPYVTNVKRSHSRLEAVHDSGSSADKYGKPEALLDARPTAKRQTFRAFLLPLILVCSVIVPLILIPKRADAVSISAFGILGIMSGELISTLTTVMQRSFALFTGALSIAYWCFHSDRPYLPLSAWILGLGGGRLFFNFLRSSTGKSSYRRVVFAGVVLVPFAFGWLVFMLHATVEDESARHAKGEETAYAEQIMPKIASLVCRPNFARTLETLRAFADFRKLNLKQELYLNDSEKHWLIRESVVESNSFRRIADDSPSRKDGFDSFFARTMTSPRKPIFAQAAMHPCGPDVWLSIVFFSEPLKGAVQRAIHIRDFIFLAILALVALPFVAINTRRRIWPFDEILGEIRSAVSLASSDQQLRPPEFRGGAAARPVIKAVFQLVAHFRETRNKAEQADGELRLIASLAAREYHEFVGMMREAVFGLDNALSAAPVVEEARVSRQIRLLEGLIEPQLSFTQALFELAQGKRRARGEKPTEANLAELVDDLIIDLVGLCNLHSIVVKSSVSEEAQILADLRVLRLALISLLFGLLKTAARDSVIRVSSSAGGSVTQLVVESTMAKNADAQDCNRQDLKSQHFGVIVAAEILSQFGLRTSLQTGRSTSEDCAQVVVEVDLPTAA